MYGIYIVDCGSNKGKSGWIVKTRRNNKVDPTNLNGEQCVEPVLSIDKPKTWERADSAIKYANNLKYRLKTVTYYPMLNYDSRYYHNMRYIIRVMNLETDVCVYNIAPYSFNSSCK